MTCCFFGIIFLNSHDDGSNTNNDHDDVARKKKARNDVVVDIALSLPLLSSLAMLDPL